MRRTKDESEQTRQRILAAARSEFARRGVTRTSLEHIARAAGVTRGAIYWHFANKAALFNAMREQVSVPLLDRTEFALLTSSAAEGGPLAAIERFMRALVDTVLRDAPTRDTFEILNLKCEYVDELDAQRAVQAARCQELAAKLEALYASAQRSGALREGLAPDLAALDSCIFMVGLLRMALLMGPRSSVRRRAGELIAAHVAQKRGHAPKRRTHASARP